MFLPGLEHLKTEPTTAFAMDRHEVTNREFKRFIDAGGYRRAKYWASLSIDGRELSFKEAIARFTDRTGRPGPSTWEVGAYPPGQDDYPVSGVSWYEAAAYAEWAGKSLPTIFHWNRVAFTVGSSRIVPMSNLASGGPVPVGSTKSLNRFGVSDLAATCVSGRGTSAAAARSVSFWAAAGRTPTMRSSTPTRSRRSIARRPMASAAFAISNEEPQLAELQRPIDRLHRDFLAEKPVSDAVFAQYLRQFAYDKKPLDAKIEEEKQIASGPRQKITFTAAYGGADDGVSVPSAEGQPPYQVVVVFPGSGAISARSSARRSRPHRFSGQERARGHLADVQGHVRAGRRPALRLRGGDDGLQGLRRHVGQGSGANDRLPRNAQGSGRHSRRLLRLELGRRVGRDLPAVEPRIKANVLYVAGLMFQRALPEADQINYVTRVKQPTLILNGELDFFFPAETSQRPMFELLGTPRRSQEAARLPRRPFGAAHGDDQGVARLARSLPRTGQVGERPASLPRSGGERPKKRNLEPFPNRITSNGTKGAQRWPRARRRNELRRHHLPGTVISTR